jgi:hypothetical protein
VARATAFSFCVVGTAGLSLGAIDWSRRGRKQILRFAQNDFSSLKGEEAEELAMLMSASAA